MQKLMPFSVIMLIFRIKNDILTVNTRLEIAVILEVNLDELPVLCARNVLALLRNLREQQPVSSDDAHLMTGFLPIRTLSVEIAVAGRREYEGAGAEVVNVHINNKLI